MPALHSTSGSNRPPRRAGAGPAPRGAGQWLRRWGVLLTLLWPAAAYALAPHELLLLVNQNSPRSLEIANRYIQLRQLPPENVVYLALPANVLEPSAECSPDEFTRWIWEPVRQILHERGLENRILAWAYSADFPVRVSSSPPLSLTGLTFTRNEFPPAGLTATGRYVSVFFAGPNYPGGPLADSHSLRWFRDTTYGALPLPAMLLAHTGARGLEVAEVLQSLEKASAPGPRDGRTGTVWLVTSDDVRSKMRDWQFPQAKGELAEAGVTAEIVKTLPSAGAAPVLGLMSGAAWITPPALAYLPGCYADHCTSFGALFHTADQTKLSAWLRAGATLSAGTVTEPFSIWTKFPSARFFAHYAHGCSALESLAQSVLCPLQLLPVGDPLAAPWAKSYRVWLEQQAAEGRVAFRLRWTAPEELALNIQFFLDGRPLGEASHRDEVIIATTRLADGYHRVMAVASTGFLVFHTAAAESGFRLDRQGRAVTLDGVPADGRVDLFHPLRLSVSAAGAPREVGLYCGTRLLARDRRGDFTLDPATLGAGVVALQGAAFHADGTVVRSDPVRLEIRRDNRPPIIRGIASQAGRQRTIAVQPEVVDPDGDPVTLSWCQQLPLTNAHAAAAAAGIVLSATPAGMALSTTNAAAVWLWPRRARGVLTEAAVTLLPTADSLTARARAGLVFNIRGGALAFFGIVGETSGWTLGTFRAGTLTPLAARGAPVRPGVAYRLSVRAGARGALECRVNDELVLRQEDTLLKGESVGFLVGGSGAVFTNLLVSPPDLPRNAVSFDGSRMLLQPGAVLEAGLLLQADDGHVSVTQPWQPGP